MEWLNEPGSWQRTDDVLQVNVNPGTDFWRVTGYGYIRDSGHVYGEVLAGDLDVAVRIRGNWSAQYDQAGVMLRADERTWLKTGIEFFEGRPRLSTVLTLGMSSWTVANLPDDTDDVALRLSRRGDAVEIRYSTRRGPPELAALVYLPPDGELLAGVMCAAPEGSGFSVSFHELRIACRDEYARPKSTRFPYADGRPQRTQVPCAGWPSAGMQRGVADVAALMSSSQSGWPQWNARAQPVATAPANSSHESTVRGPPLAELGGPPQQQVLEGRQLGAQPVRRGVERNGCLPLAEPGGHQRRARRQVPGAEFQPDRYAAHLPVVELETGGQLRPVIHVRPDGHLAQPAGQVLDVRQDLLRLIAPADRDDHHLVGSEQRRQHEALVVPVRHDHAADHAGRSCPTRWCGTVPVRRSRPRTGC